MTHNTQLTARHLTQEELDEQAKRKVIEELTQRAHDLAVKDEYVRLMQLKEARDNATGRD